MVGLCFVENRGENSVENKNEHDKTNVFQRLSMENYSN
jgi:hypothetical protein